MPQVERDLVATAMESEGFVRLIWPRGHGICNHCKCHIIYDFDLKRIRHKNPKKGEACLFLRKITDGARA